MSTKQKPKSPKKPDCFMHLRCEPRFKSLLMVEANAEGRTLSNYVFALLEEARIKRRSNKPTQ